MKSPFGIMITRRNRFRAGVGFICIQALAAHTASAGPPCRSASQRQPRSRSESIGKEFPVRGSVDFDSTVTTDRGMPGYRVELAAESTSTNTTQDSKIWNSSVDDVGIPVAGTKLSSRMDDAVVSSRVIIPDQTDPGNGSSRGTVEQSSLVDRSSRFGR